MFIFLTNISLKLMSKLYHIYVFIQITNILIIVHLNKKSKNLHLVFFSFETFKKLKNKFIIMHLIFVVCAYISDLVKIFKHATLYFRKLGQHIGFFLIADKKNIKIMQPKFMIIIIRLLKKKLLKI